ncbi:hypothetical protein NP087_23790, partial [Salmonella enterica]|nr:hypothetical protein [Salmonella enterica]
LRGVRQQQDEPGRFSICSRQAAVVHVGGRASVKGEKIDYSFVDNQPQEGGSYKPKTGVFLYGCMNSDKRPSWVEKIYTRTGVFRGGIED